MLDRYKRITNKIVRMVNNVSGKNQKTLNTFAPLPLRKKIAAFANYCSEQRLVAGTSGQISFRLPANNFMVTNPEISFSRLSASDFEVRSLRDDRAEIDYAGSFQNISRKILQQSNNNAVLICHPAASLSIAAKSCKIDQNLLEISPEVKLFKTVDAFLASEINYQEEGNSVFLIKGFGLIAYGSSVEEAINQAETAERLCQIVLDISCR